MPIYPLTYGEVVDEAEPLQVGAQRVGDVHGEVVELETGAVDGLRVGGD